MRKKSEIKFKLLRKKVENTKKGFTIARKLWWYDKIWSGKHLKNGKKNKIKQLYQCEKAILTQI